MNKNSCYIARERGREKGEGETKHFFWLFTQDEEEKKSINTFFPPQHTRLERERAHLEYRY
jgi:hypothetical protein